MRLSLSAVTALAVMLLACGSASGLDGGVTDAGADAGPAADAGWTADASVSTTDLRVVAFLLDGRTLLDGGRRVFVGDERAMIAWWADPDGGQWTSAPGLTLVDGGYQFRGVPAGVEVTVVFPSAPAVVTTSRFIDATLAVQGRADALPPPTQPTSYSIEMTGLSLTTAYDSIVAASPDTPWVVGRRTLAPGLVAEQLAVPFADLKLPLSGEGDRLLGLHLATKYPPTASWWSYTAPVAAGQGRLTGLQAGQAASVPIRLSTGPLVTARVSVDLAAFTANARLGVQYTSESENAFSIRAVPGVRTWGLVTNGVFGNEGVVTVVFSRGGSNPGPLQMASFEWLDVFPRQELVATMVHLNSLALHSNLRLRLPHERTTFVEPVVTLRPTLSPPRNLRVDGLDTGAAIGARVGETPTLEWDPPLSGNVARYTVSFARIQPNMQQFPDLAPIATFVTQATRLRVPPLTLIRSQRVAAFVRAWSGEFDPARPNFVPVPHEVTTAAIGDFEP